MKEHKDYMAKKGRHIKLIIICVMALLMFAACGNRPTKKEQVLAVFEEQKELILEKIEDYIAGDEVEWDDLEGVLSVTTNFESSGIIQFECIAEGILTSSFQAGFYYSPNDVPDYVGWFVYEQDELVEDGNGYSYSDGTDNRYYTERIYVNFYYYTESN